VTDALGKPGEFCVSHPVRPNSVQRALYGASLEPHIGVSLCGIPLYHELRNRDQLSLILLVDPQYLLLGSRVPCSVARIAKAGEQIEVASDDTGHRVTLRSKNEAHQPIVLTCPISYGHEQSQATQALVEKNSQNIDLLEPFERMSGR
jgi:hypothetical protein